MKKTVFSFVLFFLFTATYAITNQVNEEEIPEAINKTLEEKFSNYYVVDFQLIKNKTVTLYQLELESPENVLEVLIDLKGNVIKKEEKTETKPPEKTETENDVETDNDVE